jgi:uncharacterized protein YkwD
MVNGNLTYFNYDCEDKERVEDSIRIANFDFLSSSELKELDLLVVKYVNEHRIKNGLGKLPWDSELYKITESHTEYQFDNGVVEHEQNGKSYVERVRENGIYMGECVLLTGPCVNIDDKARIIVRQWVESPTHNRILLDIKAKSISVSTKLGTFYCSWANNNLYLGSGVSTLNVRY